ncbi:MAG: NADP-dependent malic enzyme, partial [Bdellovibrionales bacterium]|nr:NADP-dependent malic enzyme [Bdellovibrionales bacterium]
KKFSFGPEYIIPKPFDPRVLMNVAPAVAKAAMDTGVARIPIKNLNKYRESLEDLESVTRGFMRKLFNKIKYNARQNNDDVPTLIFPEGRSEKILKALNSIASEKICKPILLGYEDDIRAKIEALDLEEIKDIPIYQPSRHPKFAEYCAELYNMRQRKGVMEAEAERLMADPYFFAAMAVHMKDVDGTVSGSIQNYADCVKPILQIIGVTENNVASGLNIVLFKEKMYFFSDTTININPSAEEIAKIAINAAHTAQYFHQTPKIAMLSFSNFTGRTDSAMKMQHAARIVKELHPEFIVDGEMQADTAVNSEITERIFPFCEIKNGANVLIFPNLDAGNIAYKLVQQLSDGEVLGPFLMGVNRAANVMQRTGTVSDCMNTIALTALESQAYKELREDG